MKLSVVTLNTWGLPWVSQDLEFRAGEIAREIVRLDADVAMLQEVVSRKFRKILKSDLKRLSKKKLNFASFGGGLVVVSKHKIHKSRFQKYSLGGSLFDGSVFDLLIDKGAAWFEIEKGKQRVMLVNTHMVSNGDESRSDNFSHYQTTDLLWQLRQYEDNKPLIVAGDFNQRPRGLGYEMLTSLGKLVDASKSLVTLDLDNKFRKGRPDHTHYQLDYVFFREVLGWKVRHKSRLVFEKLIKLPSGKHTNYSDHYGIWAEFEFEPVLSSAKELIGEMTSPLGSHLSTVYYYYQKLALNRLLVWLGLLAGFVALGLVAVNYLPNMFVGIVEALVLVLCLAGLYGSFREFVFVSRILKSESLKPRFNMESIDEN